MMSHALLVVMLLQGSAGAAPSVVATKPATVRPVPTSYRALVAGAAGESFRDVAKVAVVDMPALAADEVLVEVRYAGINGGCETFRARGEHGVRVASMAYDLIAAFASVRKDADRRHIM